MIPVVVYCVIEMMILWLKQSDTCVNGGLLNDDTLIKTKGYLEIKTSDWMMIYWIMILWLKQSDTCVNGGLLNDDTLIKTNVSMVVYWMMIFWLKQMCQWWFIEWWYFD